MPTWIEVESTMITGIAHEGQDLYVRFKKGTKYVYHNVPHQVIAEMLAAESKGSYFMRNIKGNYEYEEVQ